MPPPPCCHTPVPAGIFDRSLRNDAERFSRYVGGGWPLPAIQLANFLTSGLHLEMKLWDPPPLRRYTINVSDAPLLWRYKINDAVRNAWKAARPILTRNPFPGGDQARLLENVGGVFPAPLATECAILRYDRWILNQIIAIRATGLAQPNAAGVNLGPPTMLATVGMAQKVVNIYVKYIFCWEIAGQWRLPGPAFQRFPLPFATRDFLCALHAPIDRIVINELLDLPIGKYLRKLGLLFPGQLRQSSDGSQRPWSKLDCLRTYYGIQLIFRRVAMAAWPKGCACAVSAENAIKQCGEMFENEFTRGTGCVSPGCVGPDWIQVASDIPDEVITETITALTRRAPQNSKASESQRTDADCRVNRPDEQAAGIPLSADKSPIYIQKGPGNYLKIVSHCGARRNDGMICILHGHIWFKKQGAPRYLLGEILRQDPDIVIQPLKPGALPCVGGTGYQGSFSCGSSHNAELLLKKYFEVRHCP